MFKKSFSMSKKIVLLSFLVMFLVTCFPNPAFAYGGLCESRTWISFHGGFVYTSVGWVLMGYYAFDFKIYCVEAVVIVLDIGVNNFELDFDDLILDNKWRWVNINPTMRYYFGKRSRRLMPFLTFGPGLYIPKEGDIRGGGKLGFGIDFSISKRLMVEIGTDYHHVFLKDSDLYKDQKSDFFNAHAGFILQL